MGRSAIANRVAKASRAAVGSRSAVTAVRISNIPGSVAGLVQWNVGGVGTDRARWPDISDNGHDYIQATLARQPTIISSAINGLSARRLDGVAQLMVSTYTLIQPETVFLVYKSITIGAAATNDIIFDGASGVATMALISDTTTKTTMNAGSSIAASATAIANGAYAYVTCQFNAASSFLNVAGSQLISGQVGAGNGGGMTLGALQNISRPTNIEVAEVLIYSTAVSAANIAIIETYLKRKYAL